MLTFASTNRLVTDPELPCEESVERRTVAVAGFAFASGSVKVQEASAVAVYTPAALLLTVTEHVRVLPLPPGLPHVSVIVAPAGPVTCGVIEFSTAVVPAGMAVVE